MSSKIAKGNDAKSKPYFLMHRKWTSNEAKREIDKGLGILDRVDKPIVTFLGSHMVSPRSKYYRHAERIAYRLGKDGYAVVTGGGPGIMYAANAGAFRAGAPSIGIRASLIRNEPIMGDVYTSTHSFTFLFVRRFLLSVKSDALLFYPGGFGTLNELFEYVVLMETGMVKKVPIIMVDKKFWRGLFKWVRKDLLREKLITHGTEDLSIFHFVDDIDEIIAIIEKNR